MKNLPLLLAIFLGIIFSAKAQDTERTSSLTSFQKSITFDVRGNNLTRGIKYDMRLNRGQRHGIGFRVGLSVFNATPAETIDNTLNPVFAAPIELNYIFGKGRHGFVTGLGAIPAISGSAYLKTVNNSVLQGEELDVIGGFMTLGYRYTSIGKGITLQVNYTPRYLKNETFDTHTSISLGYTFN